MKKIRFWKSLGENLEKIASSNKNKMYNFLKAAINEDYLNKLKKIIENNKMWQWEHLLMLLGWYSKFFT